ncbi:PREDICTED: serglycin-like [Nanorana parkeri]|uniref:serglycin-like n=1 Tax=Nanorana parkeri TaxID=125878 RepID=UPI0008549988|nr:PREDICTED: serglycin-like [Nanorana parkeri]
MLLLFCVLLFAGSLVEGLPMKREQYQRIRCRPGDNSVACFQEQSLFEQGEISNKIETDAVMRKVPSFIVPNSISGEDSGSGNGVFSGEEPGSVKEYDSESNEIREYKFQNNLSEENLIL